MTSTWPPAPHRAGTAPRSAASCSSRSPSDLRRTRSGAKEDSNQQRQGRALSPPRPIRLVTFKLGGKHISDGIVERPRAWQRGGRQGLGPLFSEVSPSPA